MLNITKKGKRNLVSILPRVMTDFGKRKKSKSKQIMENVKFQRLKELFDKLDDDHDGYISAKKIRHT